MKRSLLMFAGLGMVVGIILAGLNIATAQETPSTTPDKAPAEKAPAQEPDRKFGGHRGFGKFGPGGHGGFGKFGIHGEFTTKAPDGGYRTVASQTGEVTSVSKSSITVKSEDGFSRSYAVDENTLVNAGRDGIDSVKTGDQVQLMALVEGEKARAVRIMDTTNVERLRERWR